MSDGEDKTILRPRTPRAHEARLCVEIRFPWESMAARDGVR